MLLILLLSHPINIQGRDLYFNDFVKKAYVGLRSDIDRLISFTLCMMIDPTKLYGLDHTELYTLRLVRMALTAIQGHSCMRKQKLLQ